MTVLERFTTSAREVVVGAQGEARRLSAPRIGTEHLLLALLAAPDTRAAEVLRDAGLGPDLVRRRIAVETARLADSREADDAAALESIGIDLPVVRERLERAFGPGAWERASAAPRRRRFGLRRHRTGGRTSGHIPFSPGAKEVLELSLREAVQLRHREISAEHVLLGLLRQRGGPGAAVLAGAGVDVVDLRRRVLAAFPRAA